MFEKLHKYIGKSVEQLVNRSDAPHVFRLHKKARRRLVRAPRRPPTLTPPARRLAQLVYYVREDLMKRAICVRAAPACLWKAMQG